MKRLNIYLLSVIISLFVAESFAQGEGIMVEGSDPNQYVFWFYIRAEIKTNRITKKPSYSVRILSKKPKSGTINRFDKDLWRNLNAGQNLVIGPFLEYADAQRAIKMYNLGRHTDETMAKEIANFQDSTAASEYYWFFLKYNVSKRKHKFIFERTAARVHSGSIQKFKETLWEGLTFKQLAIGPFALPTEAEESKRRYRIEEN